MYRTVTGYAIVVVATTVILVLSGCSGTPTVRPVSPPPSTTPTPTAAAAPAPTPLPWNALFQINATATASNGAVADLVETVYVPVASNATEIALLNSQCNYPAVPAFQGQPSWESQYPGAVYLKTTITATQRSGTPAWPNSTDPIAFSFMPVSAYTGSYVRLQASCAAGLITVPGTANGVAPLWGSNPAGGPYGWATPLGSYGFTGGGNDPGGPNSGTAVVSNCTVELSSHAKAASHHVAGWPSQTFYKQTGCVYVG